MQSKFFHVLSLHNHNNGMNDLCKKNEILNSDLCMKKDILNKDLCKKTEILNNEMLNNDLCKKKNTLNNDLTSFVYVQSRFITTM